MSTTSITPSEDDFDRHWDLLWNTRLGIRYHMHLQAAYTRLGKFITAFTLLMSSAAFTAVYQSQSAPSGLATWLMCIAALLQVLELVVDTKAKAILHSTLRQKYLQLELSLSGRDYILESEELKFKESRITIEIEEPPVIKALMDKCHNELVDIYYEKPEKHKATLTWWAKLKAAFSS
ncbi:hypothetical protein L1D24_05260 [Vibrio brasiliensis]|uniref:hypothetical protein n=1 Tax=Vibrio brasiliensis TaxID=170652 RepID=UPI001EFC905F|nr:hypothetical protein [Vibrio brasiliensis]MCG9647978.1 hypothetical protein [Vibrio brasiliensis]